MAGPSTRTSFKRRAAIAGVGATKQGFNDKNDYQLAIEALKQALDDAGLQKSSLDGLIGAGGAFGGGMKAQVLARYIGITPWISGATDYMAGPFTLQYAAFLVASGACETVACVYASTPPRQNIGKTDVPSLNDPLYGYINVNAIAGLWWTQYLARYKPHEDTLGHIVQTARDNGLLNPIAPGHPAVTLDEYRNDKYLFWPLRSLDVARVSSGAVAVIVTTPERARDCPKRPVYFEAAGRAETPGMFETPGHIENRAMREAARLVYAQAGVAPKDIDVLGVSDATTVAVVGALESYGFCEPGGTSELISAGGIRRDGKIPVNPDGGHLAGGYLVGWTQQVELVRQLRGEAGARQVANAKLALHSATGGERERYLATIYSVD